MRPGLTDALLSLRPGEEWVVRDGVVEWISNTQAPSREEVDAELARLCAAYDAAEYQRLRALEYPSLADFADAMYWLRHGDESKMERYDEMVSAVKEKYPKPES